MCFDINGNLLIVDNFSQMIVGPILDQSLEKNRNNPDLVKKYISTPREIYFFTRSGVIAILFKTLV